MEPISWPSLCLQALTSRKQITEEPSSLEAGSGGGGGQDSKCSHVPGSRNTPDGEGWAAALLDPGPFSSFCRAMRAGPWLVKNPQGSGS